MKVDVRLTVSFSEFGDVKGKLVWIGADALPQIRFMTSIPG